MTHNFVFTLFVYTLAASATPPLVWKWLGGKESVGCEG
jgi:hypothetical protein